MKDKYELKVSTRKNKKYDVYKNGDYLLSFGDKRYEQYKDSTPLKHYSHLDHNDKERRRLYKIRHKNDHIDDPNYPGFWSDKFLWG
jgi:hypothetical protein